jgi:F420-dependent oxidoreductase-like protein
MGRPGFTLGIGPSHAPAIEGRFGMSYDTVGRHTEEYVTILAALLHGEPVDVTGEELTLRGVQPQPLPQPVQLLVAALAPRLLRVAGAVADGTILWMGNARAVESHVAPRIAKAAADAGRSAPRIVAGLPVAVHDDVSEARAVAAQMFETYGQLPNYQRILDHGSVAGPGDAAIVGDEASVAAQLQDLLDAGATDIWAAIFPVGDDGAASRRRTRELLKELAAQ